MLPTVGGEWSVAKQVRQMLLLRHLDLQSGHQNCLLWAIGTVALTTDMLKGFGCRQAYESLSCRNPRATVDGYGDFSLRLMSAMA